MTMPSRTVYCACDPLNDMGENAKGMNRINRRIYTDAQTSPMLSGLLARRLAKTKGTRSNGEGKHPHRSAVHLQQISAFQVRPDERRAQRRDEIEGGKEREEREAEGNIERWQGRDGIDERTDDEPGGDGDERKEEYGRQATRGQGFGHGCGVSVVREREALGHRRRRW